MKEPPSPNNSDEWNLSDAWLGALFLLTGLMATYLVVSLFINLGGPSDRAMVSAIALPFVGIGGCLIGPILTLLGANALYQSLRPRRHTSARKKLSP